MENDRDPREPPKETNDDGRLRYFANGDVEILAPAARAFQRAPRPDQPPQLHRCPLCGMTADWPIFAAHARSCIARHPEQVMAVLGDQSRR